MVNKVRGISFCFEITNILARLPAFYVTDKMKMYDYVYRTRLEVSPICYGALSYNQKTRSPQQFTHSKLLPGQLQATDWSTYSFT